MPHEAIVLIREAVEGDAASILRVHYAAVHFTASTSYEETILDQWSSIVTEERIQKYATRPNAQKEVTLVAEVDKQVVGFGALILETRELRAVYVSPYFSRRGVGNAILQELEKIAKFKGIVELWLDSSLNAEPFYLAHGFQRLSIGEHRLNTGTKMACIKMSKTLGEVHVET